ncbi:MAG: DUF4388 domain-containing protein [Microthrixaceae bacterium]
MALQGTIDSFPVVDVLGLLSGSSKSGCLQLDGDRGRARVWISEGRIVAGEVASHPTGSAADVVFELLLNEAGSFEFLTDEAAPEENLDAEVPATIAEANAMLEEWHEVRTVVPDPGVVVQLSAEADDEEIVLQAAEWQMVAAVSRSDSGTELFTSMGLGEFEGCRRLAGLVSRGLVELGEPAAAQAEVVAPDDVVTAPEDAPEAVREVTEPFGGHGSALGASDGHGSALGASHEQGSAPEASDAPEHAAATFSGDDRPSEHLHDGSADSIEHEAADAFPERFPIDDLVGTQEPVSFESSSASPPAWGEEPTSGGQPVASGGHVPAQGGPVAPDPWSGGEGFAAPQGPAGEAEEASGEAPAGSEDVLSQIQKLSPKAAEAIAAALGEGEHG